AAEAETYAQKLTVPWIVQDGRVVIATAEPGPATVLFARQRWGAAIEFADSMSHRAVLDLVERDPAMSAQQVFTPAQVVVGYGLLTAVLAGFAFAPIATLIAMNAAMSVFYLGNFVFKGILVSVGGGRSADNDQAVEIAARALREEELPVFTVLVPMFREPKMLPALAEALRKL